MTKQAQLFETETETKAANLSDAVGCAFNHKGSEGTIIAFDAHTYAEPMFIVLFASGRRGALRPSELGAS